MTALSDYAENKILDHLLKVAAFTMPAGCFVALFTTATDEATGGTEVTGGSYARQSAVFAASAAGATSNSAAINFLNMPAVTITHVGVYDAVTAGNRLMHGALTAPITVVLGNTFVLAVGDLDVTAT